MLSVAMLFQALFFDLFNTLVHFDYGRLPQVEYRGRRIQTTTLQVWEDLRRHAGLTAEYDDFLDAFFDASRRIERKKAGGREYPSKQRFEMVRRRLGLSDQSVTSRMVEIHMEQMLGMMYLPPENLALLESLKGTPKVLASNFDHAATARRALCKFGLDEHLERIFISEEVGWRKPSPRFFQEIIDGSGYRPGDSLFVGDDPDADCRGAGRAGFHVAWLRDERHRSTESPEPPPRWTLRRLGGLKEIISVGRP